MAIRLICDAGTVVVQAGPTRDRVDITAPMDQPLRRICGPGATIRKNGRLFRVRMDRDQLPGIFAAIFDRYGA